MICSGCGAHLIDGTERCPFCREILGGNMKSNSDVTYKIENDKQVDLIRNSAKKNISSRKLRERKKKQRRKRLIGYIVLLAIAAVLISVVVGIVSLFVHLFSDKTVYSTAYYSENSIGLKYDDEIIVLTNEAFKNKADAVKNISAGMISKSENGKVTAFIDRFDKTKNQGRLSILSGDDPDDIVVIAENVSPNFKISDEGDFILFIKNANTKGNMGELWVYEDGEDPVKISDKVDSDKMIFSADNDRVVYIKNYNYKTRNGDAYYAELSDYAEHKIDSKVHGIYGTDADGEVIVYSKEYKKENSVYDIYVYNGEKSSIVVKSSGKAPVFCEDREYAFAYGDKSEDRYSLYRIDLDDALAVKVVNNMSYIERVSENGEKIVFSKRFDNNVADYYIWTEGETELKVADGVNYTKVNQVIISDDFEKIAYIANYNEEKNGGLLYYCEYDEDSVSVAEKICEDVYSCFILNDEKIVYTKNYSSKSNNAGLFMFDGIEKEINPEINPDFLTVDDCIICLYDYRAETGGSLYKIDEDLTESRITTDVFDYFLKDNGEITIARARNEKSGRFDLYETCDDEICLIKKDAEKILFY